MTTVVKKKTPIVVPEALQRRAGIVPGDTLEMKAIGGVITIVANPPADAEEYTPEQRRIVNAQLDEGLEDIRKGRVSRRFDTVDEMLASLKSGGKTSRRPKTRTR
jgi:bifunctional DNA-binding transcriptional regulator/antitoxin component of YhaV-PrlF toxin-antitoxin module